MQVTLKNVKHVASLSEETYCFTASVYVNGVNVGTAENRGHGGPTHVRVPPDVMKQLEAHAKSLPGASKYEPVPAMIDDLVTDHLIVQDAKRIARGRLVWIDAKGDMMQSKKGDARQLEAWKAQITAKGLKVLDEAQIAETMLKEAHAERAKIRAQYAAL